MFKLLGYSIIDSEYLQKEFERQANLAYLIGNYELGLLDDYGQRINIPIKLKNKLTGEYVIFKSGWMTYPNGKILIATPYGGRIK